MGIKVCVSAPLESLARFVLLSLHLPTCRRQPTGFLCIQEGGPQEHGAAGELSSRFFQYPGGSSIPAMSRGSSAACVASLFPSGCVTPHIGRLRLVLVLLIITVLGQHSSLSEQPLWAAALCLNTGLGRLWAAHGGPQQSYRRFPRWPVILSLRVTHGLCPDPNL